MATFMNSTTTDNNKYETNVITYITVGNLQIALPPNIAVKSFADGSKSLFTINPKTNKCAEILIESQKNSDKIKESDSTPVAPVDDSKVVNATTCDSKLETYKCNLCNESFQKIYLYKKHVQAHRNLKKYKCGQCYESYNIEDNYKIHLAMHSKGQPRCPICNRTFQRLASLRSHLLIHQVDETYTCQECLAEFEKSEEYLKHMEKHRTEPQHTKPKDKPYICSYCNYTFQNHEEYKEHISRHIKVKKLVYNNKKFRKKVNTKREFQYKCNQCTKSFPKLCLLERHSRIHSGEKPFACNFCDKAFAQKGTLQIHQTKHTGEKPFSCYLCPAKFCQKGNLRVHVERAHTASSAVDKLYTCSHCTCIFKRVASLNAHITRCHSDSKKSDTVSDVMERLKLLEQQTLPISNLNLKDLPSSISTIKEETILTEEHTQNNDKQNFTTIHSNINGVVQKYVVKHRKIDATRWYICSFCSKEFKKPSDLVRHIRTHTKEKPFKCNQCDMQFTLKSTLNTHLKTHSKKKDYICYICSKILTSSRSYTLHLRKHDKINVKPKQYKCAECNKLFNSLTKANIHMAVHDIKQKVDENKEKENNLKNIILKQPLYETGNGFLPVAAPKPKIPSVEYEQYKNRPCKCQHCPAAFTRLVHLKRHLLMHTGEKKFKCDICQKSFYTSYSLKEHMNFHNGIKNFACPTCNKRFVTKTILKRHMIMHTSYTPYVCPYCRKRFKSVTLCRRHINTHKRDVNLQMQDVQETDNTTIIEQPNKIIDFTSALSENIFNISDSVNRNLNPNVLTGNENLVPTDNSNIIAATGSELDKNVANFLISDNNFSNSDVSISDANSDQNLFSTVYVNYDNMHVLSTNDFNALCKLENNDSLFLNTFHELQLTDANVLLSQGADFSNDTQSFDTFNTNFMLNTIDDLDEVNITDNQNSKLSDQQLLTVNSTQLNDNLILFNDGKTDLNFAQNLEFSLPKATVSETACSQKTHNYLCITCKKIFETDIDMGNHDCKCEEYSANAQSENEKNDSPEKTKQSSQSKKTARSIGKRDKSKTHSCTNCDKTFLTKLALYRHASTAHNMKKQTKNVCPYCEKTFKKPSDLQRHVRTHTGEKPYKCEKCDKSFTLKSTRDSHYKTHNPGSNRDFNCTICNLFFSSKSSLKTHILKHTGVKPFACHLCPSKFRTSGQRKSHVESHKKNILKNQTDLNSLFVSKNTTDVDLQEDNVKSSDLLGAKTDLVPNENLELSIADNGECLNITPLLQLQNGVFLLNDLQTDAAFSSNLLQMDLDCVVAEDDVSQLVNMQAFDLNKIVDQQPFANDKLINYNAETVAAVPTLTSEEIHKPFQCDICQKTFLKRFLLNKHLKTHGLNMPYLCTKCNKGFTTESLFEKHLNTHNGHRPFACELCRNSFGEEGSLKIHLKRIHNIS